MGSYAEIAVQRAGAFDLLVAASAAVMESLKDVAEQSLLQTRRPVLLHHEPVFGLFLQLGRWFGSFLETALALVFC